MGKWERREEHRLRKRLKLKKVWNFREKKREEKILERKLKKRRENLRKRKKLNLKT